MYKHSMMLRLVTASLFPATYPVRTAAKKNEKKKLTRPKETEENKATAAVSTPTEENEAGTS